VAAMGCPQSVERVSPKSPMPSGSAMLTSRDAAMTS